MMKHALIVCAVGSGIPLIRSSSIRYGDAELKTDDANVLGRINVLIGELQLPIGPAEHISEFLRAALRCSSRYTTTSSRY